MVWTKRLLQELERPGLVACAVVRLRANRLSDRAVADMIKRRALAVSLDRAFASRSLRVGFATEGDAQARVPQLPDGLDTEKAVDLQKRAIVDGQACVQGPAFPQVGAL